MEEIKIEKKQKEKLLRSNVKLGTLPLSKVKGDLYGACTL